MCILCWDALFQIGCPCGGDCPKWDGQWHRPCNQFYRNSCYHTPYVERQWRENRQGKSTRRINLIRRAWHPRDDESLDNLCSIIHTVYYDQSSIRFAAQRDRRWCNRVVTGQNMTQSTLTLKD